MGGPWARGLPFSGVEAHLGGKEVLFGAEWARVPKLRVCSLRAFSALCSSVFLFPTFWPSPGSVQVMATLQKFIANYGHINQNGLRGLSPSFG